MNKKTAFTKKAVFKKVLNLKADYLMYIVISPHPPAVPSDDLK